MNFVGFGYLAGLIIFWIYHTSSMA
jgi:hypothetical protein